MPPSAAKPGSSLEPKKGSDIRRFAGSNRGSQAHEEIAVGDDQRLNTNGILVGVELIDNILNVDFPLFGPAVPISNGDGIILRQYALN